MKNNPAIIALLIVLGAFAIHIALIQPMSQAMLSVRSELAQQQVELSEIELSIAQQSDLEGESARLEKENAQNRATLIAPMLNSYAMRAKALLGTIAQESGLTQVEYDEGELLALPVPREQVPVNRTARRSVKVKAIGDYAAIASFILRAEAELPTLAVQSLKIEQGKMKDQDNQGVEMTLEWPCQGDIIR